ncbi:uncharacterized protein LOC112970339 [Apteryx rowi]|uniref:uncharacterized protein LOC112970339 n=1 Tax=Apteryx rowi TaxID=308060 RepID=UPI000E1C8842|nr:uncharacterized protein LOC112970339 [Apteryx rowi]
MSLALLCYFCTSGAAGLVSLSLWAAPARGCAAGSPLPAGPQAALEASVCIETFPQPRFGAQSPEPGQPFPPRQRCCNVGIQGNGSTSRRSQKRGRCALQQCSHGRRRRDLQYHSVLPGASPAGRLRRFSHNPTIPARGRLDAPSEARRTARLSSGSRSRPQETLLQAIILGRVWLRSQGSQGSVLQCRPGPSVSLEAGLVQDRFCI